MKATRHVRFCIAVYYAVQGRFTFSFCESRWNPSFTIQIKATEYYFPLGSIMLYGHSNESYSALPSSGDACYPVKDGSNCGWNPKCGRIQMKASEQYFRLELSLFRIFKRKQQYNFSFCFNLGWDW